MLLNPPSLMTFASVSSVGAFSAIVKTDGSSAALVLRSATEKTRAQCQALLDTSSLLYLDCVAFILIIIYLYLQTIKLSPWEVEMFTNIASVNIKAIKFSQYLKKWKDKMLGNML